MENNIISLTAQIVSAHVAANNISVGQLPGLIRDVHGALATVGQAPAEPIKAEPAVAVKKSVFADHILCLDCGAEPQDAQAPPCQRSPDDAGRVSGQMEPASIIPDGRRLNMPRRVRSSPRTAGWVGRWRLRCRRRNAVVRGKVKTSARRSDARGGYLPAPASAPTDLRDHSPAAVTQNESDVEWWARCQSPGWAKARN